MSDASGVQQVLQMVLYAFLLTWIVGVPTLFVSFLKAGDHASVTPPRS